MRSRLGHLTSSLGNAVDMVWRRSRIRFGVVSAAQGWIELGGMTIGG